MFQVFDKASHFIDEMTRIFITSFLVLMTIVLTVHIALRYLYQGGILWSDELSRFAMVGIVYLGAASASRDGTHITVSIFEDKWPNISKYLAPIQRIILIVYSICLIIFGLNALKVVGTQSSANLGISMAWVYAVIPVSAVIIIIHLLAEFQKKPTLATKGDK